MVHLHEQPSDKTVLTVEGNKLIGQDILHGGQTSCLKQNLGTYQSPEHAEAMAYVFATPQLMLRLLMGEITPTILNNVAAILKSRKDPMTTRNLETLIGAKITNGDYGCRLVPNGGGYTLERWDDDTIQPPLTYINLTLMDTIFADMEQFLRAKLEECKVERT